MDNTEENQIIDETLVSHLEALRSTLLRCLISLGIILPITLFLAPYFLDWLVQFLIRDTKITLNFFSPAEVFILQIKIALILDLLLCFPYIAKQLWDFILPALYENERCFIKRIVLSSSILFILGIIFCISFILPLIIKFGASFATNDLKATLGISNVIGLSLWLSVIFGLMFQFPLITYSIIKTGISSYTSIKTKRPYIFTFILIISAILTPPDILSQLMLTIPTYALFEIGLYFSPKDKK